MRESNDILAGIETFAAPEELTGSSPADLPATSFPCVGTWPTTIWTVKIGC